MEKVVLPEAQTFTSPAAPTRKKKQADAEQPGGAFKYDVLSIVTPTSEEVLWGTAGEVEVTLALRPGLQDGHSVMLFLDDQMVDGKADGDLNFSLTEIDRGTHALHAEIRDSGGKTVIKSQPREFTVQQQSLFNRNNPNNNIPPVHGTVGPAG